ncbi:alpha/beta fold hydrolase [Streptomyces indicus]|uniref:Pimeloyl-ACP methyl ester carboxylesterase n=1 Tax=Streptomyces indicus TaxID=417292 RepID=A0A1G8YM25_9ACTN|nr:alpha/beta hydrolase [Streptomyces indicus]SDK03776.1 Pimeloyl-ACP methyl ester carboxylesterase [Streptomyces indicus]
MRRDGRPVPGSFVRIGGVPHHVVVEGSGPACVLTPGLGMAWFDWDAVAALLAPHRTVVRFDRPGLGLSGPSPVPPSLAGEADRIARILDACGLDGPVTVAGHSLGGFHAEAFARLHPARTAGLVLVDSSVEPAALPRPAPTLHTGLTRVAAAVLGAAGVPYALGPAGRRAAYRLVRGRRGGDPAPYSLVRRTYGTSRSLRAMLAEYATYPDLAAQLVYVRRQFPLPAGLPVTVLAAGDDARWLALQRALAGELGSAFHAVSGASHLVMLDRPDAVAAAVLSAGDPAEGPLSVARAEMTP